MAEKGEASRALAGYRFEEARLKPKLFIMRPNVCGLYGPCG